MPYFKYPTQKPGEKNTLLARHLTCQFLSRPVRRTPQPAAVAATTAAPARRDRRRNPDRRRRDPHSLLAC